MTHEQFIKHVEVTQKAFRRFLLALCCGDSSLADDIAQETYIKAYLSCDSFKNSDKFNAWIFKIGYNTFINHNRSKKIFVDYDTVVNVSAGETADSLYRYQDLYIALNKLSDKERTSVLLYYLEGYSIKEIAELEEISQDAIKKHLSRGRIHLRALMSKL